MACKSSEACFGGHDFNNDTGGFQSLELTPCNQVVFLTIVVIFMKLTFQACRLWHSCYLGYVQELRRNNAYEVCLQPVDGSRV